MLTLVATPIGNLSDISYRAVEALSSADAIYCEDTRHSIQLLNHLNIKKPLISCHEHNEQSRAREIVARLQKGEEIAYVSDAGMPGISDPGAVLVSACIENGLPYTLIPGASAVLTAAVLSGFPCGTFSFFGFLPRENKPRKKILEQIGSCRHLVILYESPHRVAGTFRELYELLGDRPAALVRELTKKFESVDRGTLLGLSEKYKEQEPKGECVITVLCEDTVETADADRMDKVILDALKEGLSAKDAAARAAELPGISKKTAYARTLELRRE